MIDTVVLTLNSNTYQEVVSRETQPWQLYAQRGAYSKYVRRLSAKLKEDRLVRPRLRRILRGNGFAVQAECSLPKLLYGENANELCDVDFPKVLDIFQDRLLEQGIAITIENLRNAIVSAVHFSKNIVLEGGYSVRQILLDLAKINLPAYINITKQTYGDAGHVLHFHTDHCEIVFYDKAMDLHTQRTRAVDRDQTPKQFTLFDWKKVELVPDIFRIEKRFGTPALVRRAIGAGKKDEVRFRDVFSQTLSVSILSREWQEIGNRSGAIFTAPTTPQTILNSILRKKLATNAKDAIYLSGLAMLAKDADGMRGLRATLKRRFSTRTWYRRVLADNGRLEGAFEGHGWIEQISLALDKYEPLRLSTFEV